MQVGPRVGLAIPALIVGGAAKAEVGAKVDQRHARRQQIVGQPLGFAMRQGGEDQVAARQQRRVPRRERACRDRPGRGGDGARRRAAPPRSRRTPPPPPCPDGRRSAASARRRHSPRHQGSKRVSCSAYAIDCIFMQELRIAPCGRGRLRGRVAHVFRRSFYARSRHSPPASSQPPPRRFPRSPRPRSSPPPRRLRGARSRPTICSS